MRQPSVLCACDKMPEIDCLKGEKVSGIEDQSSLTMWPWAYGGRVPLRGGCGSGPFTACVATTKQRRQEGVSVPASPLKVTPSATQLPQPPMSTRVRNQDFNTSAFGDI